jgi:hypothetical protein
MKKKQKSNDVDSIRTDDLKYVLSNTLDFIQHCDNKISVNLTVVALLASLPSWNDNILHLIVGSGCLNKIVLVLILICAIFGCGCLMFSLMSRTKNDKVSKSLIFFGDITKNTLTDFMQNVSETGVDDFKKDLITQIHVNSEIATKKFKWQKLGFLFTVIPIFLFIIDLSLLAMGVIS